MESSPRPSPKSGWSAAISSGVMPSRARASMISPLISSSRSLFSSMGEPRFEIGAESGREAPRRHRRSPVGVAAANGRDGLSHLDREAQLARRQVARLPLGEGGRVAAHHHRDDGAPAPQRDAGGAALEAPEASAR